MTADDARDLQVGDELVTDYHGEDRQTTVRVVAIVRGGHRVHGKGHSQTGTMVRVDPPLCRIAKNDRGMRIPGVPDVAWYDIGWFKRKLTQTVLFV